MTTLDDLHINGTTILAWLLCSAGMALIGLSCLEVVGHPYAALGMALVAFGCTAQINRRVRDCTESQRQAFEIGRESVRQLRR